MEKESECTLERTVRSYEKNILITYDCKTGCFRYPSILEKELRGRFDARSLWQIMTEDGLALPETAEQLQEIIEKMASSDMEQAYFTECFLPVREEGGRWYRVGVICSVPHTIVQITLTDIQKEIDREHCLLHTADYDKMTGLMNGEAFDRSVERILKKDKEEIKAGRYAMIYFDVLRFKAVNDIFGMEEGDCLLRHIGNVVRKSMKEGDAACRKNADRFLIFTHTWGAELEHYVKQLLAQITSFDLPFEISCNMGIYRTCDQDIEAASMADRAVLAQAAVKGSYAIRYYYYNDTLRNDMLSEQEMAGSMGTALAQKQFAVYYQPQYNNSSDTLMGAEALVRWNHPEHGILPPVSFISFFEKNGFIIRLDLYVFEQVCSFLRRCLDDGLAIVPVSTNFSKQDFFQPDFVKRLESIREKYNIPVKKLKVEITESALVSDSCRMNEVIRNLHDHGYTVEMDDFGSGYSSLNVLKNTELDVIKLDRMFLSELSQNNRGGTILSSIVRMAKWLNIPVIAEGVETKAQAEFLRSIGCDCIQGYLYSKPIPEENFRELLCSCEAGQPSIRLQLADTKDTENFWKPESLETLIFSNYVGGAAIFEYQEDKIEILRVNRKYLQEIGMNLSEKDFIESNPMEAFDPANRRIYEDMLHRAMESGKEEECETWRVFFSSCCGEERICVRSNVRLIGRRENSCLFYLMIRNITAEKKRYTEIADSERRFRMASEQINVYCWEYTVATREMRPCYRCMRDLGLPALLTNYPDSAIEMGIFPPEVADMYRDWHKQIAEGVEHLEAVIPLTVGRIPFHVRYTTEFDENGRPVKAYGSAALVV